MLKLTLPALIAYMGVQWWASWYPGAEPGGGGYIAQRMMSAKDEKHSLLATLWFTIAHYCVRPWPWILVALASLVLYPGPGDVGKGRRVRDDHPRLLAGGPQRPADRGVFRRLHVDYRHPAQPGTSFLVNDFYVRFISPKADQKHYVMVSRLDYDTDDGCGAGYHQPDDRQSPGPGSS